MARDKLPTATYRLQFNSGFTFDDAAALVPYLAELGVSHCYASPYLKARAGSPHGYDIVDHNALNPEIGDEAALRRFVDALHRHDMGQIADLVPNHMGVAGDDNAWWLDVLENGPASAYANYFDIDWRPVKETLRGKVLVPVLGDHYGTILESGQLRLTFDAGRGELSVYYWEHRFPLDPATYPGVLERDLGALLHRLGADDPQVAELQTLCNAFRHLPPRYDNGPEHAEERRRDKEVHKRHLAALCNACPPLARHIEQQVEAVNGTADDPASFDELHLLLETQAYRLAYWQVASDDINYRRFFDINDLAGLRQEEPEVFDATHRLALELVHYGQVDGLRIDHPDGLYDPAAYYQRLRAAVHEALGEDPPTDFYLVVEKILAAYEHLPEDWPVDGTTGYDFADSVGGLLVRPEAAAALTTIYQEFIGHPLDYDALLYERKRLTINVQLSSELTVLANRLSALAQQDRNTRDYTLNSLRDALATIVACFPVYRTYVADGRVRDEDRRYVDWAVAQAKKRSLAADVSIFDFIRNLLLLEGLEGRPADYRELAVRFAMKFQQYSAPVMAKALEDTTFYIYNRLAALNEVGGDPSRFATTPASFHRANSERAQHWPRGMLALSTHDTKRSADVRARLLVISELTEEWQRALGRWSRLNAGKKTDVDGRPAPSGNDEYLLYQTLLGAWPPEPLDEAGLTALRERIQQYMQKAIKEAKVHTSWVNSHAAYEEATARFIDAVLAGPPEQNRFLGDFLPLQRRVARIGMLNALVQCALHLTVPGVPDVYQGNELWDFSLVDPDNRRPVDYARRRRLLHELRNDDNGEHAPERLLACAADGRIKLLLSWRLLTLRRRFPDLFRAGDYRALACRGPREEHLVAFMRQYEGLVLVVVAARWLADLLPDDDGLALDPALWRETYLECPAELEGLQLRDALTRGRVGCRPGAGGNRIDVGQVLGALPLAILLGEAG